MAAYVHAGKKHQFAKGTSPNPSTLSYFLLERTLFWIKQVAQLRLGPSPVPKNPGLGIKRCGWNPRSAASWL